MMIGRDLREQRIGPTEVNERRVVLKVDALTKARKCRAISFELHEGEILGFYGLVGAGRTEFARVLIGEDQADSGSVYVNGQKAAINRVSDALFRYKIGYVTENRKEEGLFLDESVLTNLTLLVWKKMRHPLTRYISRKKEEEAAGKMVSGLSVRMRSLADLTANLSGGNQQKISIGRWLLADCDISDHRRTDRGCRRRLQRADPSVDLEPGTTGAESDYPYLLRDGGNHPAVQPDPGFCRSTDYW